MPPSKGTSNSYTLLLLALQIRPLEEAYKFGHFFSSLLTESDFEAKPSVLLLGQYSTGKTTFIKHLLGRDYPGIHIGPEPTTGEHMVSSHGWRLLGWVTEVITELSCSLPKGHGCCAAASGAAIC